MEKNSTTTKKAERNSKVAVVRNLGKEAERKMIKAETINENSKVGLSRRINVLVNPEEKIWKKVLKVDFIFFPIVNKIFYFLRNSIFHLFDCLVFIILQTCCFFGPACQGSEISSIWMFCKITFLYQYSLPHLTEQLEIIKEFFIRFSPEILHFYFGKVPALTITP